jgi:hypothetical protein
VKLNPQVSWPLPPEQLSGEDVFVKLAFMEIDPSVETKLKLLPEMLKVPAGLATLEVMTELPEVEPPELVKLFPLTGVATVTVTGA